MTESLKDILTILKPRRFNLHNEKILQAEIHDCLLSLHGISVVREFVLDRKNTIDFLIGEDVGIEVKIGGAKRAIFRQCERYCQFDRIKELLLVTNRSMGFPPQINGKDCYILNLGKAWL